jgi:hypothetical protein
MDCVYVKEKAAYCNVALGSCALDPLLCILNLRKHNAEFLKQRAPRDAAEDAWFNATVADQC